jgi:ActR/RegA family two-component response regulator
MDELQHRKINPKKEVVEAAMADINPDVVNQIRTHPQMFKKVLVLATYIKVVTAIGVIKAIPGNNHYLKKRNEIFLVQKA